MYYWHYATHALASIGGPAWSAWREKLVSVVTAHQRTEGEACDYKGSWDPIDPWGPDGGRVYATAILTICLAIADQTASPPVNGPVSPPVSPDSRLRTLKDRAGKWARLLRGCTNPCDLCDGRGTLRAAKCPRCLGRTVIFNSNLRHAYMDMRSPAWRNRQEAREEFENYYRRVLHGQTPSPFLQDYVIRDATLIDETHGVASIVDHGTTPTQTKWIWASEQAFPKGTWYLYTEGVDGSWPQ